MTVAFPPLFRGQPAGDPLTDAVTMAAAGTDPGLITYSIQPERLRAALVLAPEDPLEDALAMVLAAANGFADAFGALAPSEVACHIEWPGRIRIEGARAGSISATASTTDPNAVPDWLIVSIDIALADTRTDPGDDPETTTLAEEGCADITGTQLLEAWSRHTLLWIHEWEEDGIARLHRDWTGRAWNIGGEITVELHGDTATGTFTGLDERGGLLLKQANRIRLIPLSATLEPA